MLRSKYPEALKVADDASNLFKNNGFIRNQVLLGWVGWWQLRYFLCSVTVKTPI